MKKTPESDVLEDVDVVLLGWVRLIVARPNLHHLPLRVTYVYCVHRNLPFSGTRL